MSLEIKESELEAFTAISRDRTGAVLRSCIVGNHRVTSDTTKSSKDRYHAILQVAEERDEETASCIR